MFFHDEIVTITNEIEQFLHLVEHDSTSLVYHTRVFDDFILGSILGNLSNFDMDIFFDAQMDLGYFSTYGFSSSSNIFIQAFFLIYEDMCYELNSLFTFMDTKYFNNSLFELFSGQFNPILKTNISYLFLNEYALFFQNSDISAILPFQLSIFFDFIFYFDFFLIIVELFLFMLIFSFVLTDLISFFTSSKFYDSVVNFFTKNSISFLEVSIVCTIYLSFFLFDLFVSFSEDDSTDTLFYLIIIFIVLMFFFLSIAIDIQYFYMMSNSSNGDVTIRLLFFDILNNFLGILRIFLC